MPQPKPAAARLAGGLGRGPGPKLAPWGPVSLSAPACIVPASPSLWTQSTSDTGLKGPAAGGTGVGMSISV